MFFYLNKITSFTLPLGTKSLSSATKALSNGAACWGSEQNTHCPSKAQ